MTSMSGDNHGDASRQAASLWSRSDFGRVAEGYTNYFPLYIQGWDSCDPGL